MNLSASEVSRLQEVVQFWFEEVQPSARFSKDAPLDATIRARFTDLYESLSVQIPDTANLRPTTTVAAVVVLDQFPRNMFRDTARAFATDAKALSVAQHAVAHSLDRQLGDDAAGRTQRQFLYMPFMHSEDRAVQLRSVQLYVDLGDAEIVEYARQHQQIITRFGRFPHRNAVLGRTSTPEELTFLQSHPGF